MAKPLVTSAAERDYTDAMTWYSTRSPSAAERFEIEFDRALEAIGSNPERYSLCDDRHRFYLVDRFPYQIIYRRCGEDWFVIAVAHGKQRPGFWIDR